MIGFGLLFGDFAEEGGVGFFGFVVGCYGLVEGGGHFQDGDEEWRKDLERCQTDLVDIERGIIVFMREAEGYMNACLVDL